MLRKSLLGVIAVLLLAGLLVTGCSGGAAKEGKKEEKSGAAKPIVLKYAFFAPANTFPAKQMEKWKEELEKRTNNKVKVELFPGGTLLTAQNMYDGVKNGVADIGLSCPTYEPGRFPLLAISDLPSGFPNSRVASRVVFDLIKEFPPDAFKDFKIITAFATEPARLMVTEPVTNLHDLKGKQIRISGALTPVLKELGASPVGMPMSEVPEALQTGIIKGLVSSREVLMDLKLAEKLKYTTDYPLTVTSFVAVMNKDVWNSLPPDVQKVIDDLSLEMAIWTGEYMDNHVKEALEWSKKEHGLQIITLSPEEKAAWDKILKPIQDKYVEELKAKGLPAEEYKKRLYELKEKYSKQ
ncbi:TRAP transporter substrate-binding protein [Desulfofundulus thermosubterraneus]|uniref:TRAP-type C4-dicarboxylate transport system, substrate-binding protein n=1 Tax=Desulfofundulus thermosubterraneus DSM 16057 TaxID=1121432 RepID=A0A1M6APT6_9FIRM|nr:TRAP transporter substrate-binding protein [Desulfofundulus thermosubterraneus]SHI38496.1 TRAP-type C4-dicarboxylate transport system, substrate-binding protein [Desulfofundulus thermosubterraneus DSM 16057]